MRPTRLRCARCRSVGRGARGRGRGIRTLRRRRRGAACVRRAAPGGGVDQRHRAPTWRNSPNARSPWRASRPRIAFAGLADPALLARDIPDLDLLDPDLPTVAALEAACADAPRRAALAVKGVTKSGGASASAGIGGMVLVTSSGFRGAYLSSQPGRVDDRDRRRGHRDGARLRYLVGAACCRSRCRRRQSGVRPASARSSGSIRARSRPSACRWCSTAAWRAR